MSDPHIYRVVFAAQGKVYEIYAHKVSHGSMLGFLEVEELDFGKRTVVVDPSEERIKGEFEGVKRTFLPLQTIVRIDEVEKRGISKVSDAKGAGNVAQFPLMYPPGGSGGSD